MRIAFLNWRDSTHPEGGGAEKYAETVCEGLADAGHDVTMLCSTHPGAPPEERRRGVRVLRQGGRLGVYGASLRRLDALERAEVGWALESRVAPRAFRGLQYVAVSQRTREELIELGVAPEAIAVIHNGTDPAPTDSGPRHPEPRLVVLGRVVPHKRIEHALTVTARLRARHPGLRLRIVGDGWWSDKVREEAVALGVSDRVDILGFVDEQTKHAELAAAWVALAPSIKEGWGLSVVEAASHGTPTVAYTGAGGLSESIVHGRTGMLVDDLDGLTAAVDHLLTDTTTRESLGAAAIEHAANFTWARSVQAWESLLADRAAGLPVEAGTDAVVPDEVRQQRARGVSRRS